MANSKILTAEQEHTLRQPIDEYVGGIQKEIDELINKYENDKENLDLLEQLQTYDYEVEDLLKNIGAFLYEMACEDSPFGDHTELYHKTVEREWKYN